MMVRIAVVCVWIALMAAIADAQTVPIRSGEHDGFSRIVLDMPRRLSWRLLPAPEGRLLQVDQAGLLFDTSNVYYRMTDQRVSAITPVSNPAGLRFDLACDCTVTGFWHGASMLVIDVADKSASAVGTVDTNLDLAAPSSATAVELFATHMSAELPKPDAPIGAAKSPGGSTNAPSLPAARDNLAKQIARAAGLGLVTAHRPGLDVKAPDQKTAGTPPPATKQPDRPTSPVGSAPVQMFAENSASPRNPGNRAMTSEGATCPPDSALNVQDWGNDTAFYSQIGPLRTRLAQEFDRMDPVAARDLARTYLHFGFGVEAIQVLKLVPAEQTDMLHALAAILDEKPSGTFLDGLTDCDTDVALWSALSGTSLPQDAPINIDAMLRALDRLPRHLRSHLGPRLAQRLLDAAHPAEARRVLRLLGRAPDPASPPQILLEVETEPEASASDTADDLLEDVVATGGDTAARAVIRRIERRLHDKRPITPEMAQLAGSYAFERRKTDLGNDLARVHLLATAASADFESAFAGLERLATDLPPEARNRILSGMLGYLAADASDLTFLVHALRLREAAPQVVADDVSNAMADRLLSLGFPAKASAFVRPVANGSEMRVRSLLRAKIALAQRQPHRALVDLLGLSGEDANLLRAEAQAMAGRHRAAHAFYAAAGMTDLAADQAILADDKALLAQTDDAALAEIVRTMASDSDPSSMTRPATLAENRALLEQSAKMREAVARLLESRPVTAPQD